MDVFSYLKSKDKILHHAYIVVGDLDSSKNALLDAFAKRGITIQGNSDFTVETYGTFLIENVAELKSRAQNLSETNRGKFFIICAQSITREAQNALLKILEEPNQNTYFFFCFPRIEGILPTVISRVQIIKNENNGEELDLKDFFKMSYAKRLEFIKKMLDSHEDDDTSGERREVAIKFLNSVEAYIYKNNQIKESSSVLRDIYINKNYLKERGASVKMILEEIALLI